ncbi:MAG: glycosyltransferase family 4 protein, partial [Patescibacteria group bacterium]
MRIAQLVSNLHSVDPRANRPIYSLAGILANGLVKKNNEVTLFGSSNSKTDAKLHGYPTADVKTAEIPESILRHYMHSLISQCYAKADEFDIIHSHFTLLNLFYAGFVKTPSVNCIHVPISEELKPILRQFKNNNFISYSLSQRKQFPELNWVANIYHGVDTSLFTYNENPDDYYLYIGRITEEKGIHHAIEAAKAAGVKLVIAGRSWKNGDYWHKNVEPHIDGDRIRYVGEADLERKIELFRNAKALLFPTQYDEVFGLVMIEAMSCGTPVIGWNSGAVPEVVQHGETGFVVSSVE